MRGMSVDELYRRDRQLRGTLVVLGAALVAGLQIAGALLLVGAGAGCGNRATGVQQDGSAPGSDARIPGTDSAPSKVDARPAKADVGPPMTTDAGPAPQGCVAAIHVDNCCTVAEPALAAAVAADPCFVLYPPRDIPQACFDQWPETCQLVNCTFGPPPSRLVEPALGGGCQWKTECATAADCELAVDAKQCCPCPEAFPKELVAADPCVQSLNMSAWPPPGCTNLPTCDASTCGACHEVPLPECLAAPDGLKLCVPSWDA